MPFADVQVQVQVVEGSKARSNVSRRDAKQGTEEMVRRRCSVKRASERMGMSCNCRFRQAMHSGMKRGRRRIWRG